MRLMEIDAVGQALIELSEPLRYSGVPYRFVVATPRYLGENLNDLQPGDAAMCSFVGVVNLEPQAEDGSKVTSWRGGLAFIGELQRE
ncbi:MAG: hypothetical protein HC897_15235 [Thermoanaerobaculia bacterium]|nr:hypothetical protein [Thermoanaerobaculia bacterium]